MICEVCRKAGEANKLGRGLRDEGKEDDARPAFARAELFHLHCAGNCNCQHIVGLRMHD